MRFTLYCPIIVLSLALAACGHGSAPDNDAASPGAEAQQAEAPPSRTDAAASDPSSIAQAHATRPLQVSDLDAYARGMQKEIDLRQAASDKAAQAKAAHDEEAEVTALADMTSAEIDSAGARAAGLDAARYDFVKRTVDRVLGAVSMSNAMANMDGGARLQQSQGDPYAGLNGDVAAALKAREAELDKLREANVAVLLNAEKL